VSSCRCHASGVDDADGGNVTRSAMSPFRPATSSDGSTTSVEELELPWIGNLPPYHPLRTLTRSSTPSARGPRPDARAARRMLGEPPPKRKTSCRSVRRLARVDLDDLDDVPGLASGRVVVLVVLDSHPLGRASVTVTTLAALPERRDLAPAVACRPTPAEFAVTARRPGPARTRGRARPAVRRERTAFRLAHIFGFPHTPLSVRSSGARRPPPQLADQGAHCIREVSDARHARSRTDIENDSTAPYRTIHRSAVCDIIALMEVLDLDCGRRGDDLGSGRC